MSIGWVVAPRRWVPMVRAEREITGVPSALNQLALAQFMESGSYDRYLRTPRQRFRAWRAPWSASWPGSCRSAAGAAVRRASTCSWSCPPDTMISEAVEVLAEIIRAA